MSKIMIVDNDDEDLNLMKEIIEKEGHETIICKNGAEALDNLTKDGVDLILIDIQMPTLSGYDLLRLLREKINHSSKVMYVSIVPEKEVNMNDVDGFIQKPFAPENFIAKIKEVL